MSLIYDKPLSGVSRCWVPAPVVRGLDPRPRPGPWFPGSLVPWFLVEDAMTSRQEPEALPSWSEYRLLGMRFCFPASKSQMSTPLGELRGSLVSLTWNVLKKIYGFALTCLHAIFRRFIKYRFWFVSHLLFISSRISLRRGHTSHVTQRVKSIRAEARWCFRCFFNSSCMQSLFFFS